MCAALGYKSNRFLPHLAVNCFSIQAVETCWNHSNVVTPVVSINNTVNSTRFDVLNIQQNPAPHKTTLAVYMAVII